MIDKDFILDSAKFEQDFQQFPPEDRLKYAAKQAWETNQLVARLYDSFLKLKRDHDERVKAGASCSAEVTVNNLLPANVKAIMKVASLLGGGGLVTGMSLGGYLVGKVVGWW